MSEAVHEILELIQRLPDEEQLKLEHHLAERAESEWQREAQAARPLAIQKGIDQATIDRAIDKLRHRP